MSAWLPGLLALCINFSFLSGARAGVFNLTHFVDEGSFAIGFEPELNLTSGAGLGANLKYTHGISELSNFTLALGHSGGGRQFRFGLAWTLDFIPDLDSQPGIGLGFQSYYYRLATGGRFEATVVPYIHKSFVTAGNGEVDPFIAVPFGVFRRSGEYKAMTSVSVGSLFKPKRNSSVYYIIEMGVAVNNAFTYVSGGAAFYY